MMAQKYLKSYTRPFSYSLNNMCFIQINILGAVQGASENKIMAETLPLPCLPVVKNIAI